ncbi:PEP-CTERM sorting domain-containing protein [Luteolibacter ambystomatis]|uniref:PEP-CTERM sorting domain-containing protein n=1 Tax=Luteolibacter ambystomatis TaxID=2824561 RepID=A0A975G995_9BACT|nr:PEP-CTERM sorting domain-containing protein [Luteolibacter ambystomatis]QUE51116.1 PEP-CTERM sorting domain-containing protein [Luteolibacter ambystomatis]
MKILAPLFLALVAPAGAAVLISTTFTGVTSPSSSVLNNISWTGDSHLGGASSTTVSGAPNYFATPLSNGRVVPNVNVQNATGTAPFAVWTMDFTVNYTLSNAGDSLTLATVDLTGFAYNSGAVIQTAARTTAFSASILNSSLTTTFATGSLQQSIAANAANGAAFSIILAGDTSLDATDLGGTTGSFVLRISGVKPTVTEGGSYDGIDNLALNGSYVAVPEPSAALLGAFGVIGLLRRRR